MSVLFHGIAMRRPPYFLIGFSTGIGIELGFYVLLWALGPAIALWFWGEAPKRSASQPALTCTGPRCPVVRHLPAQAARMSLRSVCRVLRGEPFDGMHGLRIDAVGSGPALRPRIPSLRIACGAERSRECARTGPIPACEGRDPVADSVFEDGHEV
jgi:hypothetical protein